MSPRRKHRAINLLEYTKVYLKKLKSLYYYNLHVGLYSVNMNGTTKAPLPRYQYVSVSGLEVMLWSTAVKSQEVATLMLSQ